MCTASFAAVEEEIGIPIVRGPRHAADLSLVLPLIGKIQLSREIPADEFLANERRKEAYDRIKESEEGKIPIFSIRGVKIGGGTRIKVLAEIMDAHKQCDIRSTVLSYFEKGQISSTWFGFDATPDDVRAVFEILSDIPGPLAVDTQDPALIAASLHRADLILSLQERTYRLLDETLLRHGAQR
jgi:hypothetical protein